jgi:hypothetical protein
MKLEAPPGFEPGVEVLQSHPRFLLTLFVRAEFSQKSLSVKTITPFQAIDLKSVLLAEIGGRWLAAGTISGTVVIEHDELDKTSLQAVPVRLYESVSALIRLRLRHPAATRLTL